MPRLPSDKGVEEVVFVEGTLIPDFLFPFVPKTVSLRSQTINLPNSTLLMKTDGKPKSYNPRPSAESAKIRDSDNIQKKAR